MRIAFVQINSVLGDFAGNRQRILAYVQQAVELGCDLVVFPELCLMGYPPNDLLERRSVIKAELKEFRKLEMQIPPRIGVLTGLVTLSRKAKGKPFHNSAALLLKGQKTRFFHKELLPTYDVFDEARHIEKGSMAQGLFMLKGRRVLVTICEDIWGWDLPRHVTNYLANPLVRVKESLKGKPLDLVLNISASPFTLRKMQFRKAVVARTAAFFKAPVMYVNLVGGQDEIVFDGGSFVVDQKGKTIVQSRLFEEELSVFSLDKARLAGRNDSRAMNGKALARLSKGEQTRRALVLGIRDYVRKTGFEKAHLGLSGGIDSAVVACLAVEALGPERVSAVTLPGPFNEERSRDLAEQLAKNLGIRCLNLPIVDGYETLLKTLHSVLGRFDFGAVNENLQARLRGVLLMALSNRENSLLLATGNKSEYATGYATLYGDMCGGLAPIADLLKNEVYALAELYNRESELIPHEIITRFPSAELRPNQKDQDSLPPYDALDESVRRIIEEQKPPRSETDRFVLNASMKSEFKRWQAPPILKVSGHAFGRGRRMPIAHKAKY